MFKKLRKRKKKKEGKLRIFLTPKGRIIAAGELALREREKNKWTLK